MHKIDFFGRAEQIQNNILVTDGVTVSNLHITGVNTAQFTVLDGGHLHMKNIHSEASPIMIDGAGGTVERITIDNVVADNAALIVTNTIVSGGDLKIKNCQLPTAELPKSSLQVNSVRLLDGNLVIEKVSPEGTVTYRGVEVKIHNNSIEGYGKNLKIKDLNVNGDLSIFSNTIQNGYLIVEDSTIGNSYISYDNAIISGGIVWSDNTIKGHLLI